MSFDRHDPYDADRPLLMRCIDDHLAGQRFPLATVHTDPSVLRNG